MEDVAADGRRARLRARRAAALAAALVAAGAVPAWAGEGVREISQACALTGCFPGDGPGFPVTIAASGSYRLTSDLDLSVAPNPPSTDGIEVVADEVSIDLAGFAIRGTNQCSWDIVSRSFSCSQFGAGTGIDAGSRGTSIRNGSVRGMGTQGIACSQSCLLERIHVSHNSNAGINVGPNSSVRDVVAELNLTGFVSWGATLEHCTSLFGFNGVDLEYGSVFRAGVVNRHVNLGVLASAGSVVESSTIYSNGTGIFSEIGSRVWGNTIRSNDTGISSDASSGWGSNVLVDNGVHATGGIQIATNVCGNAVCP